MSTELRETWPPESVSVPVEPTLADLAAADRAVDLARAAYRQCGINWQVAKSEFARCVGIWNQSLPRMSALDQARQFQASELAARKAKAEAGLYRRPATITETARYRGTVKGPGGGTSFVRGGRDFVGRPVTKHQGMAIEAEAIRARRAAEATAALPAAKK